MNRIARSLRDFWDRNDSELILMFGLGGSALASLAVFYTLLAHGLSPLEAGSSTTLVLVIGFAISFFGLASDLFNVEEPARGIVAGTSISFLPLALVILGPRLVQAMSSYNKGSDLGTLLQSATIAVGSAIWLILAAGALVLGLKIVVNFPGGRKYTPTRSLCLILVLYVASFGMLGKIVYDEWAWLSAMALLASGGVLVWQGYCLSRAYDKAKVLIIGTSIGVFMFAGRSVLEPSFGKIWIIVPLTVVLLLFGTYILLEMTKQRKT